MRQVDVLDSGFVRLVDSMGDDLSIVRAARVSYDADWREHGEKNDNKLVRYLMLNHHTSPFEAVTLTFEVKAPIFVFRQWHRHRTWSYNEVSARYTELDEGFYVPSYNVIGEQSKSSKQSRDITDTSNVGVAQWAEMTMTIHNGKAFDTYRELLEKGCPRELARSVLPLAAYSRMFATVDLHNLFHFLRLRLHPHAQWEIQEYARAMLELTQDVAPVACEAFREGLKRG
jgi:thymidylate synthase (FAD)